MQRKSELLYTRSPINVGPIQESPGEIQSPTQRKVIGRIMVTPSSRVVAQQCFSASLFSLRFHSVQESLGDRYKNVISLFFFLLFIKTGNVCKM